MFRSQTDHHQGDTIFLLTSVTKFIVLILYFIYKFYIQQMVFENRAMYETIWKATDDNLAHSHRMLDTKGYKYHSDYVIQYVIPITFPQQQWVHERVSLLYLYVDCLSCC